MRDILNKASENLYAIITITLVVGVAVLAVTAGLKRDRTSTYKNYLYECTRTTDGKLFIFERKDAKLTIAIPGPSYFTITDDDGYSVEIPSTPTAAFSCRKKHIGTYNR